MKKSLKTAFLYIGTAIGAGFSSGKEIALFFGEVSPLNVAVSSVFMSILCGFFLIAGKRRLIPKNKLIGLGISLSAGISLCAMCAGGEFVMHSMTGVPMLGLILAVIGGIIVVLGIEKIKIVNTVIVPLIVICVAIIFFKLDPQNHSLPFSVAKPIAYSGLDVLLGGVIISEEGEKLSYKEIIMSCAIICVCLFGLLFMLQTVVLADDLHTSMPVLSVSEKFGLKAICGVLIAGAIFTTLVSSLKILSDRLISAIEHSRLVNGKGIKNYKSLVVFGCLLVAYPISFIGFDAIVDNAYPFISICGIILAAATFLRASVKALRVLAREIVRRKNAKKNAALSGDASVNGSRGNHNRRRARGNDTRHRRIRARGSGIRHRRRTPRNLPRPATVPRKEICGRRTRPSL